MWHNPMRVVTIPVSWGDWITYVCGTRYVPWYLLCHQSTHTICSNFWPWSYWGTQDLLTSNNSEMGGFSCRIPEKELLSIQNCTRYIRDPAITIKICLLSINIPCLQPFSSLTTWVTTYKNPKQRVLQSLITPPSLKTHFLISTTSSPAKPSSSLSAGPQNCTPWY